MPSTFLGLNTGLSGLNYYQASLNTTGHNISNADTKGYSRQGVLSRAADAIRLRTAYGMMGTGVQMTGIMQFRNLYYDTKFRSSTSRLNEYSGLQEQLTQLESYIKGDFAASATGTEETGAGYTRLLNRLNATLQTLSTSPSDASYRTQFIQSAANFADLINEIAVNYQKAQEDINNEVAIHVDTINSISAQIYTLNQQIINIETRGGNANDLRDQRELLVDQLSELVNVEVIESPIMYGTGEDAIPSGASRYEVRIGGALLVDEMECRQLKVVAREQKVNQNDIDGLYDVFWQGKNNTIGEKFNFNSSNITGRIKGLLEVRDGNNANPFSGNITELKSGDKETGEAATAVIELLEGIDLDKLNLPMEGTITLNCKEYYYDGFEAEYDETTGKLVKFTFKNLTVTGKNGSREPAVFNEALDLNKMGIMGESVDCRGIPYYMTQLNEFVRTLSKYMNDIFTTGADANGDPGMDFFTTLNPATGEDFVLTTGKTPTSMASDGSNYYRITALNWSVNEEILHDQNKLVVSYKADVDQGNKDAKGVLEQIIYGFNDQAMYSQGTISQFLQAITTSLAVDISKYDAFSTNMNDVATVINNQRMSISSVDTNEEASNLIIFQNGYNLSCKIISVMNEVYDKLINQTG